MKVVSRKSTNPHVLRRDQMLAERTRAAALRDVFPHVGQLRIELIFNDLGAHTPSPQQHTLFRAAPAFFRFACPCIDCNGDFDLTGAVTRLVGTMSGNKRTGVSSNGQLACQGVRLHDRAGNNGCSMQLNFRLSSAPPSEA